MSLVIAEVLDSLSDLAEFRRCVAVFLSQQLPVRLAKTPRVGIALPVRQQLEWQSILHANGLGAPGWPIEHGGRGWSLRKMHVWWEECAKARAPRPLLQAISMIGPILQKYGTAAQRARHLPGILSGEVVWCQGYSEPGAGSDLAQLQTRADRHGDRFVVNGQKIWTTFAHEADWMFALVRTGKEGPPQKGISFLLMDMESPGISVRPLVSIDGLHHLNEVYFRDVEVPAEQLIGEENRGWDYAKALLNHERLGICDPTELRARMNALRTFLVSAEGREYLGDSYQDIARKISELEISLSSLEASYARILEQLETGREAGPAVAALKYLDTAITQSLHEIGLETAGIYGVPDQTPAFDPKNNYRPLGPEGLSLAYAGYAFSRANSIAGGTSEVQKNIVWRSLADV